MCKLPPRNNLLLTERLACYSKRNGLPIVGEGKALGQMLVGYVVGADVMGAMDEVCFSGTYGA